RAKNGLGGAWTLGSGQAARQTFNAAGSVWLRALTCFIRAGLTTVPLFSYLGQRRVGTNFFPKPIPLVAVPLLPIHRKHGLRSRHRFLDVAFRQRVRPHKLSRALFQRPDSRQTILSPVVGYEMASRRQIKRVRQFIS